MNRFSKGPVASEFMNTHVAPPLELMHQAMQYKQQQYDVRKMYQQEYQDQLTGLEVTGQYAQNYLKGVQDEFGNVVNELKGKDLLDPRNQKMLDGVIGKISNDDELKQHLSINKYAKEWKANRDKLVGENALHDANTWEYDDALTEYSLTGKASPELQNTTIHKAVDRYDGAMKFFKDLQASGTDAVAFLRGSSADGTDSVAYENSYSGISRGTINAQADRILYAAMNDPYGQELDREYKMLTKRNGMKYTKEGSMTYLKQNLLAVGETKVHSKTSSGLAAAINKKNDIGREKKKEQAMELPMIGTAINGATKDVPGATLNDKGMWEAKDEEGFGTKLGNVFKVMYNTPAGAWSATIPKAWSGNPEGRKLAAEATAQNIVSERLGTTAKQLQEKHAAPIELHGVTVSKKETDAINNMLYGPGGKGLGNIINFGIFDGGKKVDAVAGIASALKKSGHNIDEDVTASELLTYMRENKIAPSITNKVGSGNPFSPAMWEMNIEGQPLKIDLTQGMQPKQVNDLIERGFMKPQDLENHKQAKFQHYGYFTETSEDGKSMKVHYLKDNQQHTESVNYDNIGK